jgi:hypothetical protein
MKIMICQKYIQLIKFFILEGDLLPFMRKPRTEARTRANIRKPATYIGTFIIDSAKAIRA